MLRILGTLLLLTFSISSYAAPDDLDELRAETHEWVLAKHDERRNIKTYAKRELGKRVRSFKVEAVIDAPLDVVVRVHDDYDNYKRWYFQTLDSKLLKRVSPTEVYYYSVLNAPYGLPDRDVVLHKVIEPYTPQRGYLQFTTRAVPKYLPPHEKYVRVTAMDMTVKFTPLEANKTRIQAEGYLDPGGDDAFSPAWAVNYVQRSGPYAVMLGIQRMVTMPQYQRAN